MCGLTGFVSNQFSTRERMTEVAVEMARRLSHRGPDDHGVWIDQDHDIALAHQRLAVLDLTSAGHQPALSACGRFVMIFNGEIYNHVSIRKELEANYSNSLGHEQQKLSWRGHSDTETLLAAISTWGLEKTLKKSTGMFAIALWDRRNHTLSLARDRMGEKPLYYGFHGNALLFGSELKAIRAFPGFNASVNREALALYLRHNYVPGPYSIYHGIRKLLPGTILRISQADIARQVLATPQAYWSLKDVAIKGQKNLYDGTEAEAGLELDRILRESISSQMIADVPLGAFLSGGIDSTTVSTLMQAQSNIPVKTFTIGFYESAYNEAKHAHDVAAYLGTEHTELYITPDEAIDVIPSLPELYDEPFADASQIPTYLVSKLARQYVTVSLSGDGGDELFGGYNRYVFGPAIWRRIHWLPRNLRIALAGVLTTLPPALWDKIFYTLNVFLPRSKKFSSPTDKIHKIAELCANKSPEEIYAALITQWKKSEDIIKIDPGNIPDLTISNTQVDISELEHRMMYMDSVSYLPDDILTKVDRAAMGVSLETRVPFLDHRLIEFAWQIPLSMKIRQSKGKWLLRQVLDQYIPRNLVDRPKNGFAIPLSDWLRGPLKDWADQLLNQQRLASDGFLRTVPVRKMWLQHKNGKRNWSYHLWSLLMFQAWFKSISG